MATAAALLATCAAIIGCPPFGATPCETASDCAGSAEAEAAGRCGPELACIDGACRAECLGHCEITPTRFPTNPCESGGLCDQPAQPTTISSGFRCTKLPIRCRVATDCPVFKPDAGDWSCEDGVCRFPGFRYEYEDGT